MDINEMISQAISKVQSDPAVLSHFMEDPGKAAEELLGVDLPDEQIDDFVNGIKGNFLGDDGQFDLGDLANIAEGFFK